MVSSGQHGKLTIFDVRSDKFSPDELPDLELLSGDIAEAFIRTRATEPGSLLSSRQLPTMPALLSTPQTVKPKPADQQVVRDFILFDIGLLRGYAGELAFQRFRDLSTSAIPAVVEGLIEAANIEASCPIVVISRKLSDLLNSCSDPALLRYACERLNQDWPRCRHGAMAAEVQRRAQTRYRQVLALLIDRELPQLLSALRNPDASVRRSAAVMMGSHEAVREPVVILSLAEALRDSEPEVRRAAAQALVNAGAAATDVLVAALTREESQLEACWALAALSPPAEASVPQLVRLLVANRAEVRNAAGDALVRIGAPAVPALTRALADEAVRCEAALILGEMGEAARSAVPELIRGLRDPSKDFRHAAHQALVRLGSPAVPALVAAARASEPRVWFSALVALRKLGGKARSVVPDLIDITRGSDASKCVLALDTLMQIDSTNPAVRVAIEAALPEVRLTLRHPNKDVRTWAVRCLQNMGVAGEPALPDLLQAVRDPATEVRASAASALGHLRICRPEVVAALMTALDDSEPVVRRNAAKALGLFRSAASDAIPRLIQLQGDSDVETQRAATDALLLMTPTAIPQLVHALESDNEAVRRGSAVALARSGLAAADKLQQVLKHPRASVRVLAAQTLAQIGPDARSATTALLDASQDSDAMVRLHAVEALASIDPQAPGVARALAQRLDDTSAAVCRSARAALAQAGSAAVPVLGDALRTRHVKRLELVLAVLKEIGSPARDVLPVIQGMLKDTNWRVREQACHALVAIDTSMPVMRAVVECLADDDEHVYVAAHLALVKAGKQALPVLAEGLRHPDVLIRRGVAETIKKIVVEGHTRAELFNLVPMLVGALRDSDPIVRDSAGWALSEVEPRLKEALPELRQAVRASPSTVNELPPGTALELLPLPQLLAAACTTNDLQQLAVLSELARRRGREVLVALTVATQAKDPRVQSCACQLLRDYLTTAPQPGVDQQAAIRLALCRKLEEAGRTQIAIERYQQLIRDFPGTPAAEEARVHLASKK
ncbi:MAG: HEAT repeat domain-containing protein [Gemmataceae bacterium]|nr:HEAT repeat domain-containing protein [Gemmataceae bacterium]MDW8264167.1 HEAT repeat domain-containing protein [Gemmataceae bacterium]